MPSICHECQDIVRNATGAIFDILKPYAASKCIGDQAWTLTTVLLRKIENQVASKAEAGSQNTIIRHFIEPGLALLPPTMDTPEARVMLVAIALQESRFEHRLQIRGPARGFWQFERAGGVAGVIRHPSTKGLIRGACERLHFSCTPEACHEAIAYNDTLACIFARLLLWTVPGPLPEINDANEAWDYYLDAWRPGKPHRETWDRLHARAVEIVTKGDL